MKSWSSVPALLVTLNGYDPSVGGQSLPNDLHDLVGHFPAEGDQACGSSSGICYGALGGLSE